MRKDKIVLTGGHAVTTALAVIQQLQKEKNYEIHWVGSSNPIEGRKVFSLDSKLFPKLGVICHYIPAGRIQRRFTKYTIPSLLRIPLGIIAAFILMLKIRPKSIVSFGGYAGFPTVLAGFLLRIPVLLHEQTVAVGLANKVSAYFSSKIAISYKESFRYFPKDKCVLTGNPVMENITSVKPKTKIEVPPTVFLTGGSRGSQIINKVVAESLPLILKKYHLIHQCGVLDFEKFLALKKKMGSLSKHYEVYDQIDPTLIGTMYEKADIYVGRSGANTVAEVVITKRPAIFIPIPWARFNEQNLNAQKAQQLGLAKIIDQDKLTKQTFIITLDEVLENWKKMSSIPADNEFRIHSFSARKIVELVDKL